MTKSQPIQLQHFGQYHCPAQNRPSDIQLSNPISSQPPLHKTPASIYPHQASFPTDLLSSSSLQLLPATYDDIPAIVDIHVEAYRNDVMVRLEYGGTPLAEIRKAMIANMQEQWTKWDDEGLWAIKAVVNGEAVGCAVWGVKDGKRRKQTLEGVEKMSGSWEARRHLELRQAFGPPRCEHLSKWRKTSNQANTTDKYWANTENDLRNAAHAKLMQLHAKWVNEDTRFLYLGSIAVKLSAQARGVGSAMLHAGMQRADKEGLLIWLEATPAGHPVYEHFGWKTVDSVEIDLSDFGGKDKGYGVYKYWGCIRMPLL